MKQIKEILHKNDLVCTSCREEIIRVFSSSDTPLSEDEIKTQINASFNRSTFYRTFKTLLKKRIIHKIVVDNKLIKYALSKSDETEKHHAHFFCLKCKNIYCMPSVEWKYSNISNEYTVTETELIIKGYCKNCK